MKFAASLVKRTLKFHAKKNREANRILKNVISKAKEVLRPARKVAERAADKGHRNINLSNDIFGELTEAIRIYFQHPYKKINHCESVLSHVFGVKTSVNLNCSLFFEWKLPTEDDVCPLSLSSSSTSDESSSTSSDESE